MNRLLKLLLFTLVLGITTGQAGSALPAVIEKSLAAGSSKTANSLLESALKDKNTSDSDRAWIELYLAENLRLSGALKEARQHFESVAVNFPNHKAYAGASVGIACVDTKGIPGGNVRATLESAAEEGLPPSLNADRFLLLVKAGKADGTDGEQVATWMKKARKYANAAPKEVASRVNEELSAFQEAIPTAPSVAPDLSAIRSVRQLLASGKLQEAKDAATKLASQYPDSEYVSEANSTQLREVAPIRKRIGVLLPETGTWAPAAKNLKVALEMAAERSDSSVELVFFDSAGLGATCVTRLQEAVYKKGVSLVIGPLLKDEAQECAPAAQKMGVPMVAMTSWEEVIGVGSHIYRAYPSTGQLISALLHETVDVRGLKRYAMLYPKNPYGENAAHLFEGQLAGVGGTLVASMSYDPAAVDFTKTAAAFKAKDPTLSYDAIFIPDTYGRVGLLAPALAFQELPVGRFRPKSNSNPIVLVGLNSWNNDEFPRRGGTYVIDSIFVDAFNPHLEDLVISDFVNGYKEKAEASPTLVEAVGYDTVRLVSAAVKGSDPDLEASFRVARLADPVAGTIAVQDDREISRNWRMLTVGRNGIEPLPVWQPPEESPPQ